MARNVLICADENLLVYNTSLSGNEIENWARIAGLDPHDVFDLDDKEMQYYVISDRLYMDEKKDDNVRKVLSDKGLS